MATPSPPLSDPLRLSQLPARAIIKYVSVQTRTKHSCCNSPYLSCSSSTCRRVSASERPEVCICTRVWGIQQERQGCRRHSAAWPLPHIQDPVAPLVCVCTKPGGCARWDVPLLLARQPQATAGRRNHVDTRLCMYGRYEGITVDGRNAISHSSGTGPYGCPSAAAVSDRI
jgi:hypothetical protein